MLKTPQPESDLDRFQPFEPQEVLYEFDGPRIFTILDRDEEWNLAYWSDESADAWRYVVVATSPAIVQALRTGALTVYDALDQPRCWLCDIGHDGEIAGCQRVDFESISRDSLPNPSTLLWPSIEPRHVDVVGRIRELDKDRLSFELREIEGTPSVQRFNFDKELMAAVSQAFQDDARVQVGGKTVPPLNVAQAVSLSRVTTG